MSRRRPAWTATVRVHVDRPGAARWLERALSPEAEREVPRARTLVRRDRDRIELRIEASDAGAMRAAMNTYLGWIALGVATLGAAVSTAPAPPDVAAGEALISRSR